MSGDPLWAPVLGPTRRDSPQSSHAGLVRQAPHPDYGVDAPRCLGDWLVLGTGAAALALAGRLPPPLRVGTAVFAAWALGTSATWLPSSRLMKVCEAERLVEAAPLLTTPPSRV
jgi:hypothetical protein